MYSPPPTTKGGLRRTVGRFDGIPFLSGARLRRPSKFGGEATEKLVHLRKPYVLSTRLEFYDALDIHLTYIQRYFLLKYGNRYQNLWDMFTVIPIDPQTASCASALQQLHCGSLMVELTFIGKNGGA